MEKALDILKECLELEKIKMKGYEHLSNIAYIQEAIYELEEAQLTRREWYQKGYAEAMKHKTCEGCFYDDKDGVLHVECAFCLRNSNDNFKPKDTQC